MKKFFSVFKTHIYYFFIGVIFFSFGVVFFLLKRSWIIFHWVPAYKRSDDVSSVLKKRVFPKKVIFLYYWKDENIKKEQRSFVWLSSKADTLRQIVGNWLTLMYEERLLDKKVDIESVALSSSGQQAYISFSQVPFVKEWSIHKKRLLLQSLCRTVAGAGLSVQAIVFLNKGELMVDDHLDFSFPWSVDCFS